MLFPKGRAPAAFVFSALASLPLPKARAAELKPYGFILVNTAQHWGRPNFLDVPTQALSHSGADTRGTFHATHVRQSRLGLNVEGIAGWRDSRIAGTVEMDFWGNRATAGAANDVLQASPRLRLAFLQAKWGSHALVFGQDWAKAFAPLNPASLFHQAVPAMQHSGNLWNRFPQFRWDAAWLSGDTGVATRLAAVRPHSADQMGRTVAGNPAVVQADSPGSGEASGLPGWHALIEASRKAGGRTFIAGASMQYLRRKFGAGLTPAAATGADNYTVDGVLGALHAVLPVHERVEISGEFFHGNSNQNLQGLGVVFNNNGAFNTSQTRGGWLQAAVKPAEGWKLHLIGGFEKIDKTGLAAASPYRNETWMLNAAWDWSKELSWSAEYGHVRTDYAAIAAGRSQNLGLAAMLKF